MAQNEPSHAQAFMLQYTYMFNLIPVLIDHDTDRKEQKNSCLLTRHGERKGERKVQVQVQIQIQIESEPA